MPGVVERVPFCHVGIRNTIWLEVEPDDLEGVEKKLKAAITRNEANFLKDLNDWLAKSRGKITSE